MSIKVMSAVWDGSRHSGTDLLMLLALADFSDDQGNSYPAVPTLAAKCRMQPRNANYILKALQESGELQIRANEGPRGTNRYRIVLEALKGVQSIAGVGVQSSAPLKPAAPLQRSAQTPAMECAKPLQPIADKPSLNRQEPSGKKYKRTSVLTTSQLVADGLSEQTASEWLAHRRRKRSELTPRAWDGIKAQAHKAGWTVEEAVCKALERGWQSFEAEWVNTAAQPVQRGYAKPQQQTTAERDAEARRLLGFKGIDYCEGTEQ